MCRLGIRGHGITTPPAADLPEQWLSMLTRYHRRKPYVAPASGSWAATAVGLPELDGARVAVLGLHHGEDSTILHLHAGGVTMEDDLEDYRGVRPLPALWIRDSAGRWHATRTGPRGRWATTARSRLSWRSSRRSRQHPVIDIVADGNRPRSGPGSRSAGSGILSWPAPASAAWCLGSLG